MSKELTPLEALNNIKLKLMRSYDNSCGCNGNAMFEKELPILETALKRLEQQDSVLKTLKEVIKFSQTLPRVEPNEHNGFSIMSAISINVQRDIENKERELLRQWVLKTCFPKELKALEIIKEKNDLDIELLFYCFEQPNNSYKTYNEHNERKWLKKQEYDLLKEVLL